MFLGDGFLVGGFLGDGFLGDGFLGDGFLGDGFLGDGLLRCLEFDERLRVIRSRIIKRALKSGVICVRFQFVIVVLY